MRVGIEPDLTEHSQLAARSRKLLDALVKRRDQPLALPYRVPVADGEISCLVARPGRGRRQLLLLGDSRGSISIWDVVTKPPALDGHFHAVASLSKEDLGISSVQAACWAPSGSSIAVGGEISGPGAKASKVSAWTLHGSENAGSVYQLCKHVELKKDWTLREHGLSFCGRDLSLAVAVSVGAFFSMIVIYDLDYDLDDLQAEKHRLVLAREAREDLRGLGSFSIGSNHLYVSAGFMVLLWTPGTPERSSKVEVSYGGANKTLARRDVGFEKDSMRVSYVTLGGLAALAGVRGGEGWILLGWKLALSGGGWGPVTAPKNQEDFDLLLKGDTNFTLVFQPPTSSVQRIPAATPVKSSAVAPNGTLIAVGCEKTKQGQWNSFPSLPDADSSAEPVTLTIWSLESKAWCVWDLALGATVQSMTWVSNSMLLAGLTQSHSVALINVESGGVMREWSFSMQQQPLLVACAPGSPWVAVAFRRAARNHTEEACALFSLEVGGGSRVPMDLPSEKNADTAVLTSSEAGLIAIEEVSLKSELRHVPTQTSLSQSSQSSLQGPRTRRRALGLCIWRLDSNEKVASFPEDKRVTSVAFGEDFVVASLKGREGGFVKAFQLPQAPERRQGQLYSESYYLELTCVAARGSLSDGDAVFVAGGKGNAHPSSAPETEVWIGQVWWLGPNPPLRESDEASKAALQDKSLKCARLSCSLASSEVVGIEVGALAFLRHRSWLAGGLQHGNSSLALIWDLSEPGSIKLLRELNFYLDLSGLNCMALAQERLGPESPSQSRPRPSPRPRANSKGQLKGVRSADERVTMLACSGKGSRIVVHDIRLGLANFSFDIRSYEEKQTGTSRHATITVLRFSENLKLLAAGDTGGCVHLFSLSKTSRRPQRKLCLQGRVCSLFLKDEHLDRAVCIRDADEIVRSKSRMQAALVNRPKMSVLAAGDSTAKQEFVVYDLSSPSLEFLLPALQLEAYQEKNDLRTQLELMPTLVHQRLLLQEYGWSLLHLCAACGLVQAAKLLVRMSASPLVLDTSGLNAIDVALEHREFGMAEELLLTLTEQVSGEQAHTSVRTKGKHPVADVLPVQHTALSHTVVRCLHYGVTSLPDFLDTACCGVPRVDDESVVLPVRAALGDHELNLQAYGAPIFRHVPELQDLVPEFKVERNTPERPAEVRVWFLRGILDHEVGLVPALKEEGQDDIMRTKFAHVVLQYKWRGGAKNLFRRELAIYLAYMSCFAGWCKAGRARAEVAMDWQADFRTFAGAFYQSSRVILLIFSGFFVVDEVRQLWFEMKINRIKSPGVMAIITSAKGYFTTWNNLDLARICLVGYAIVWSFFDREGVFLGEGRNLLAFTALVVCSRLVSFLRAFSATGHLVRTLITIFWDIRIFFGLMAMILASFLFAFHLLFDQNLGALAFFETFWFVYQHGMIGEGADAPEGADGDTVSARVLLFGMGLVLLVVMMNFLIAIMGDTYDKVQESAQVAKNLMRLELVYEADIAALAQARSKDEFQPKAYVFTCEGMRNAHGSNERAGQEQGMWEGRVKQVEKAVKRASAKSSAAITEHSMRMEALEEKVLSLESQLVHGQNRIHEALEKLLEMQRHDHQETDLPRQKS